MQLALYCLRGVKIMKKLICILLAVIMCFGMLGAAEADPAQSELLTQSVSCPSAQADNDELFAGYVDMLFYGDRGGEPPQSVGGAAAGNLLEGDNKLAYDALVQEIKKIASGERSSTVISIGQSVNGEAADVYVEFGGGFEDFNLHLVHSALLADCVYELYWYDKTLGCSLSYYEGTPIPQLIFRFYVADAYVGGDDFTADTSRTGAAAAAAANAKTVVADYASLSDYRKLVAYKEYICGAVDYNDDAAAGGMSYGDPWQLIHVFDGDEQTKVVCEGYSKAFQYLCDMSQWSGGVNCYTVDGYMYAGGSGGAHMWNVVNIGGANYLVDVTNSDEGSIGQAGDLFLAGSGNERSSVFTFSYSDGSTRNIRLYGYRFSAGLSGTKVDYYYDYDLIWGDDVLTLAEDDYVPPAGLENISLDRDKLSLEPGQSETLTAVLTPEDESAELEWSSSNTDVAVVENGVVRAIAPGSATITVSAEGLSASCTVSVDAVYECEKNADGSLTISLPADILEQTKMLIVVGYENGKMSDCRVLTEAEWTNTLSLEGTQFKAFVLGDGYLPIEQAISPLG